MQVGSNPIIQTRTKIFIKVKDKKRLNKSLSYAIKKVCQDLYILYTVFKSAFICATIRNVSIRRYRKILKHNGRDRR